MLLLLLPVQWLLILQLQKSLLLLTMTPEAALQHNNRLQYNPTPNTNCTHILT
jgi:hypothetical protein